MSYISLLPLNATLFSTFYSMHIFPKFLYHKWQTFCSFLMILTLWCLLWCLWTSRICYFSEITSVVPQEYCNFYVPTFYIVCRNFILVLRHSNSNGTFTVIMDFFYSLSIANNATFFTDIISEIRQWHVKSTVNKQFHTKYQSCG